MKRVVLIVLDSVGIGALPDAHEFGDTGSNTLGHIAEQVDLNLPVLQQMGLGNIAPLKGVEFTESPLAYFGKAAEKAKGKDTSTGHWEIACAINKNPFPAYPNGFPEAFVTAFYEKTGYEILCNTPYSGTQVIQDYGQQSLEEKKLIVYTSADPVLQIAAHETMISPNKLYEICQIALELTKIYCPVARVIARPFLGESNQIYTRTANRKDFSVKPPCKTLLDRLNEKDVPVIGIGKTSDIFAGQGITESLGANKNNTDGVEKTIKTLQTHPEGLIFTNLVDFDSKYGHRRDVEGYAKALEEFDRQLPLILSELNSEDVLILTADHGCDPTFKGTDHTREYIPILMYSKANLKGKSIGIRQSFSDIGATIEEILLKENTLEGISFYKEMISS